MRLSIVKNNDGSATSAKLPFRTVEIDDSSSMLMSLEQF